MNKILRNTFKISFHALHSNKVRTVLAIIGIMIGISSIIIVFATGEGIRGLVQDQIEAFGAESIQTEIKVPSNKIGLASERQSATNLIQGTQITTLTLDDMEDITRLSNIRDGYAMIMTQERVVYNEEIRRTIVLAVTQKFDDIDKSEIDYGRFFNDSEDKSLAQVAVLGSNIKQKIFGDSDPIGKSIKVRNTRFKVIGVMKEQGAVMTMDFDDFVYVPLRTMQKKIMGVNFIHSMIHRVNDISLINETAEDMRALLRDNHDISQPTEQRDGWADTGKDDFRVMPMTEIMEVWDNITGTLTLLVMAIAAISLLVGGVGVMNVMYVIVNERTHEIGLRKAVGAKYSDVMLQFLIESVLITFMGGIAGIIFGSAMAFLISFGAGYMGFDWNFAIPIRAFIIAVFFSLIFGVIFGVYPARKAARMDPIDALRTE